MCYKYTLCAPVTLTFDLELSKSVSLRVYMGGNMHVNMKSLRQLFVEISHVKVFHILTSSDLDLQGHMLNFNMYFPLTMIHVL